MKFKLEIDCNNRAFMDNDDGNRCDDGARDAEVGRMLIDLGKSLRNQCGICVLYDVHGNKVGTATFEP